MDIRPIHTEADYKATLKEISDLMESDPDLGTPEGDRLDILATLVQACEAKRSSQSCMVMGMRRMA